MDCLTPVEIQRRLRSKNGFIMPASLDVRDCRGKLGYREGHGRALERELKAAGISFEMIVNESDIIDIIATEAAERNNAREEFKKKMKLVVHNIHDEIQLKMEDSAIERFMEEYARLFSAE